MVFGYATSRMILYCAGKKFRGFAVFSQDREIKSREISSFFLSTAKIKEFSNREIVKNRKIKRDLIEFFKSIKNFQ